MVESVGRVAHSMPSQGLDVVIVGNRYARQVDVPSKALAKLSQAASQAGSFDGTGQVHALSTAKKPLSNASGADPTSLSLEGDAAAAGAAQAASGPGAALPRTILGVLSFLGGQLPADPDAIRCAAVAAGVQASYRRRGLDLAR